jgi:hypothetical protein
MARKVIPLTPAKSTPGSQSIRNPFRTPSNPPHPPQNLILQATFGNEQLNIVSLNTISLTPLQRTRTKMPVPIEARVKGGFFNQVHMGLKTFLKNVMGPESNAR